MNREIMQQVVIALRGLMTGYVGDAEDAIYAIEKELAKPEQSNYSDIVSDGGLDPRNKFDAQPEQEPVQFLLNGARYKVALQHHFGNSIVGLPEHLNGQWVALVDATDGKHLNYTAPPRKERELEQAIREERGRCHQLVWDYGFSKVGNNDVQEACATLAKRILAMGKK